MTTRYLFDDLHQLVGQPVTLQGNSVFVKFGKNKWSYFKNEQPNKIYKVIAILPGKPSGKCNPKLLVESTTGITFRMVVNCHSVEQFDAVHKRFSK